jgi:lysine 2,3-aminomutase
MSKFEPDPLGEDKCTVFPGLIHKHSDRILVEMNFNCPKVCEFCTRKRKGINKNDFKLTMEDWLKIEDYINKNSKIREVMFSGGDPLITQELLIKILERLKSNERIKIIRIHTRIPITAPEMVTKELLEYFLKESPKRIFYVSIHCDHKNELTDEAKECIEKLRLSGVILYSQSVFLKNINDSVKALKDLFEALLELGVRPYYLYQCDKIEGWQKFMIPLKKEKQLMRELNKRVSGLACPILVIDSEEGKKRVAYGF